MNTHRQQLPMAIADCALDPVALAEQADRYRRLATAAHAIERRADRVLVTFEPTVDHELLNETIVTERRCCPFFTLDYDTSERRLSISIGDPLRRDALDAVLSAIRVGASAR
ncbi:MAG: hypothetical protein ACR2QA_00040 [Solirubrobacteraceae bacterium]